MELVATLQTVHFTMLENYLIISHNAFDSYFADLRVYAKRFSKNTPASLKFSKKK